MLNNSKICIRQKCCFESPKYLNSDVASDNLMKKDVDTDGFVCEVDYKGAKAKEAGSWGLSTQHFDQGAGTFVAHTMKTADLG